MILLISQLDLPPYEKRRASQVGPLSLRALNRRATRVRFLVRQEAWLILPVERYWPWELLVHREVDPAAA